MTPRFPLFQDMNVFLYNYMRPLDIFLSECLFISFPRFIDAHCTELLVSTSFSRSLAWLQHGLIDFKTKYKPFSLISINMELLILNFRMNCLDPRCFSNQTVV